MKIIEILEDFWYRVGYFIRHDFIRVLMSLGKFVVGFPLIWYWDSKQFFAGKKVLGKILGWAKVIILGGLMMGCFAIKGFFERFSERRKKKGGVR